MFLKKSQRAAQWPLIETLIAKNFISKIDAALAKFLLKQNFNEESAAFLCYMSMALRAGHLCVKMENGSLFPNPENLFPTPEDLSKANLADFRHMAQKGFLSLPKHLYLDVDGSQTPLIRNDTSFYFQRYWQAEALMLSQLERIQRTPATIQPNMERVCTLLNELKQLLPEQISAIKEGCSKSIFLLCGGPGTGKTYTAGHLIKTFWASISAEEQSRCQIALAAPTGKAAANLQTSLAKATSHLSNFPQIQAKTLHALLEIRSGKPLHREIPLAADFILVDECSMIDTQMMAALLAAVKPGARLILLGDRFQLPPVGAGTPFSSLVSSLSTVELKSCMRSELKPIVDFAAAIQRGDGDAALAILSKNCEGIKHVSIQAQVQQTLIDHALSYFKSLDFDALNRFCILSPVREGPLGVETLNALIAKKMMHAMRHQKQFIAPIVIMKNDYRLNLSNGEIGLLVQTTDTFGRIHKEDYALFPDREAGGSAVRKLSALLLPKFEYAYCLSIHKSQGSEFDHVLVLMPKGMEIFGREILYTAVTRARKNLEIWGSSEMILSTVARSARS